MKRFTKIFLLSLCVWFLFLGIGYTQDGWNIQQDTSYSVSCDSYWCTINPIWWLMQKLLIWIWIILWVIMIISTTKAIILHRNHNLKNTFLDFLPILNLYIASKTIIWRILFFFLILLVWFFGYSLYRNINDNWCCFDAPSWRDYTWVIIWVFAIIILSILFSRLVDFYKKSPHD